MKTTIASIVENSWGVIRVIFAFVLLIVAKLIPGMMGAALFLWLFGARFVAERLALSGPRLENVQMGMNIEGKPDNVTPEGLYGRSITNDLPAPFTKWHLLYTPKAGLCAMVASVVATGDYDAQFSQLRIKFIDEYGEPTDFTDNERWFEWTAVNVDDIDTIRLAKFYETGSPIGIGVFYQFTNFSNCQAEAGAMRQESPLKGLL